MSVSFKINAGFACCSVIHNMIMNCMAFAGNAAIKSLTYQLSTVGYWPNVAMTSNGELGFDSGEGA